MKQMAMPPLTRPALGRLSIRRKGGFVRSLATALLTAGLSAAPLVHAAGTYSTLSQFTETNGSNPRTLIKASDGDYYGTTLNGGANGRGVIFKVSASTGAVTVLRDVTASESSVDHCVLMEGEDGLLYGHTNHGGSSDQGTLFSISKTGTYTTLASFTGSEGTIPGYGLVDGGDGSLYGVTTVGGTNNGGTFFKYSLAGGTITKLADFSEAVGHHPGCNLVKATDGNFYGATLMGGDSGHGTVFRASTDGTLTKMASFSNQSVRDCMIQATDGNLYGLSDTGGAFDAELFRVTLSGTLSTAATWGVGAGQYPRGIYEGPDGKFYITNIFGGATNDGSVVSVTKTGTVSLIKSFDTASLGLVHGYANFILGASNQLVGIAGEGGNANVGGIYQISGLFTPAIAIDEPNASGLASNDTVEMGASYTGYPTSKTFTIRNTGTGNLIISNITKVGGALTEYAVSGITFPATIAPQSETTFDVTLTPAVTGTRGTTLRVLSNDPGLGTFNIKVTSVTTPPQPITFSTTLMKVKQGSTKAVVTLKRTYTKVAQTVTITTADGDAQDWPPFSPAVLGVDYQAPSATVTFPIGAKTKTVTIPLLPKAGSANKQFTASLSNATGGAVVGSPSTMTIQVTATDSTPPTLTVVDPSVAIATLDAVLNPTIDINGTAFDARGVTEVSIRLNNAPYAPATLGTPSPDGTTLPFTASVTPRLGLNTIQIFAWDVRGNRTVVTRKITLTGGADLVMVRSVPGAMSAKPDSVGYIKMAVTPSTNATTVTPTTANSNPKSCKVLPGAPVTLTAVAKTGYVFSHWSNLPAGASAAGNVATFAMPVAGASVTATFIANVFTPPTGTGASFYGLIHPDSGVASAKNTEGFFTATVASTTGAFSGKVLIDGVSQSISGSFFGDGSGAFKVGTSLQSSLTVAGRAMTVSFDTVARDNITVHLDENGAEACSGVALRGYYTKTRKVPAGWLNSSTSGFYTFATSIPTAADSVSQPTGYGYGTLTVSNVGVVTVKGTLADGTVFTAAPTALTSADTCPVYVQLLTPGASTKNGVYAGEIVFDTTQADTDVSSVTMLWIRPASSAKLYTAGWPDGVTCDFIGAKYNKATNLQTSLGAGSSAPTGNVTLGFEDGKLSPDIAISELNIVGNAITKVNAADTSFKLTATPTAALISGSFHPNWAPLDSIDPTFKGIVLQKGANKAGLGFFISNVKSDNDPEAGRVTLFAQ